MAVYQSSISRFIANLKANDPSLEERQKEGRLIYWEKTPIDLNERRRQNSVKIRQKPYVYYQ